RGGTRPASISKPEGCQNIARDDGDVLLSVHLVSDGRVEDGAAQIGFPEQGAVPGVKGVEIAFASPRKKNVRGRDQIARVCHVELRKTPGAFSGFWVQRNSGSASNLVRPIVDGPAPCLAQGRCA